MKIFFCLLSLWRILRRCLKWRDNFILLECFRIEWAFLSVSVFIQSSHCADYWQFSKCSPLHTVSCGPSLLCECLSVPPAWLITQGWKNKSGTRVWRTQFELKEEGAGCTCFLLPDSRMPKRFCSRQSQRLKLVLVTYSVQGLVHCGYLGRVCVDRRKRKERRKGRWRLLASLSF